jgi:hypothetical protein
MSTFLSLFFLRFSLLIRNFRGFFGSFREFEVLLGIACNSRFFEYFLVLIWAIWLIWRFFLWILVVIRWVLWIFRLFLFLKHFKALDVYILDVDKCFSCWFWIVLPVFKGSWMFFLLILDSFICFFLKIPECIFAVFWIFLISLWRTPGVFL